MQQLPKKTSFQPVTNTISILTTLAFGLTGIGAITMFGYRGAIVTEADIHALGLSTFAGLSTSVGAIIAVIQKPDDAMLAFLLGLAFGVMATLSVVEMWIKNAAENGIVIITIAFVVGALLYYFAQPYFPDFEMSPCNSKVEEEPLQPESGTSSSPSRDSQKRSLSPKVLATDMSATERLVSASKHASTTIPPAQLLRLGLLMAFTMTLHNMPEGLAVAFSSYNGMGWIMAIAISLHNIPEGIIVAAPVFAATGSRSNALLIATLSGLSEPFGALLSILFVKPFVTEQRLHCTMSLMGGVMLSVCVLELWPEAKKCKFDHRALQGIVLGTVLMGATLAAEF